MHELRLHKNTPDKSDQGIGPEVQNARGTSFISCT